MYHYYMMYLCISQAILIQICIIICMDKDLTFYREALKYQREQAGLSQHQLAEKVGISQGNISRWESGEAIPNIEFCIRLADFYGISLDELVGRKDGDTPPSIL